VKVTHGAACAGVFSTTFLIVLSCLLVAKMAPNKRVQLGKSEAHRYTSLQTTENPRSNGVDRSAKQVTKQV
jgi:hypothetical protein